MIFLKAEDLNEKSNLNGLAGLRLPNSQFYPQSIRRIISLGNGAKGRVKGAVHNKWVTRALRIDSRELFMIRANSTNDSREEAN